MTDELKAYYAEQLDQDDNLVGTYTDADGNTVVLVLDDTPETLAPHMLRAEGVRFVKSSGFSIIPPAWPDKPAAPAEAKPLDYINPEKRHRPAMGGISVGHKDISAGTLGCYVIDNVTGQRVILSNNHVLAAVDNGKVGDAILQPGRADGGDLPGDLIGTLARYVPIRVSTTKLVDCAIAKMVNLADVEENIINIGKPHGMAAPYVGQVLKKYGRTSEYSQGGVAATDATVKVDYGGVTLTLQDLIITGIPSFPGDSGSLCVDFSSNAAVGLLFAGGVMDGYGVTILCRMEHVARLLNITVPMPDPIQRSLWLDISKWQGAVDFAKMKSRGVRGVVMKVCESSDHIDPQFSTYYAAARAAGLLVGGYIFVDPGEASANAHYANFINALGDRVLDIPPVLDCEKTGASAQTNTACIQNLSELLSDWYGGLPIIYTSVGWWDANVLPWSGWKNHPLWIAFWSTTASFPAVPAAWKVDGQVVPGQPVMWQWRVFKGGGAYFGVSSADIDMDTTFPSFEALLGEPLPPPETVQLTVQIIGSGSVSPSGGQYPQGENLTLQATPADGWRFVEWGYDLAGAPNPATLVMDDDKNISAVFEESESGGVATFEHFKGVQVLTVNLNIRSGPGVSYTKLYSIPPGSVVEILDTALDAYGNEWARVGYGAWSAMVYNGSEYIRYIME